MFDLDHALKALTGHIDWLTAWPALSGVAYLFAVSPRLALIDIRERRLPNKLVLPGFIVTFAGQLWAACLATDDLVRLVLGISCAVLVFASGLFCNLRFGLGMGDVKLSAAMTLCLAWFDPLLVGILFAVAALSGATQVLVHGLWRGRLRLQNSIAFGPHLIVGLAVTAVIFVIAAL